jgi:hypothetical protein
LAATLTALCIIMLKQSPTFYSPSPVTPWSFVHLSSVKSILFWCGRVDIKIINRHFDCVQTSCFFPWSCRNSILKLEACLLFAPRKYRSSHSRNCIATFTSPVKGIWIFLRASFKCEISCPISIMFGHWITNWVYDFFFNVLDDLFFSSLCMKKGWFMS